MPIKVPGPTSDGDRRRGPRAVFALMSFFVTVSLSPAIDAAEGKLELVRKIPHSGYSEGIDLYEGSLWSAQPKVLRKISPLTGEVMATYKPASEYSESLSWWGSDLWTVSYSDNGIYKGKLRDNGIAFARVGTTPEVHAWGLTHDDRYLILTGDHGSRSLYFVDPRTLKLVRQLRTEISDLEDLAWDGEGIWSSSFTAKKGHVFRIHPNTGKIQGVYELPEPQMCPVVDGIAAMGNELWITGKECPAVYLVKNPLVRPRK